MSITTPTRRAYSAVHSAALASVAWGTTTLSPHVPAPLGHGSVSPWASLPPNVTMTMSGSLVVQRVAQVRRPVVEVGAGETRRHDVVELDVDQPGLVEQPLQVRSERAGIAVADDEHLRRVVLGGRAGLLRLGRRWRSAVRSSACRVTWADAPSATPATATVVDDSPDASTSGASP